MLNLHFERILLNVFYYRILESKSFRKFKIVSLYVNILETNCNIILL